MAWDIRARALVYELGTGNNAVRALSWDAKRSALYAATECDYMDRNVYTHDYRSARIPRWARLDPNDHSDFGPMSESMEVDEDEEEEYHSLEDDDDDRAWPNMAHHSETHFGYAYDAGEHVLREWPFLFDMDRVRTNVTTMVSAVWVQRGPRLEGTSRIRPGDCRERQLLVNDFGSDVIL